MRNFAQGAAVEKIGGDTLRIVLKSPTGEQTYHDLTLAEAEAVREGIERGAAEIAADAEAAAKATAIAVAEKAEAERQATPPAPSAPEPKSKSSRRKNTGKEK